MIKTKNSLLKQSFYLLLSVICLNAPSYALEKNHSKEKQPFFSDVIGIKEKHLSSRYWQDKLVNGQQLLLSQQQIAQLNTQQFQQGHYLRAPLVLPSKIDGQIIKTWIQSVSKVSSYPRFFFDGKPVEANHYQQWRELLALDQIEQERTVEFALVTNRSSLRTFPHLILVTSDDKDSNLDRFQESAVFPGEAVAVLHLSQDKQWAFVQNYHYRAWMQLADLAIGDRAIIDSFLKPKQRLVVTGAKVLTNYSPNNPEVSNVVLEMGTSLPLIAPSDYGTHYLDKQNVYASHIVQLPTRSETGRLVIKPALISRSQDVNVGYLPLTQQNLLAQSFKFLGERYGWGHDFNGRDCSGFIGEIYKSFGLMLPRNTSQQKKAKVGINIPLDSHSTNEQKITQLSNLQVGDLLFLPGHVAMVIGYYNNQPYIIHDVYEMKYFDKQGQLYQGKLNGVSVTPLIPFTHYIESMTTVKRLWQLR